MATINTTLLPFTVENPETKPLAAEAYPLHAEGVSYRDLGRFLFPGHRNSHRRARRLVEKGWFLHLRIARS